MKSTLPTLVASLFLAMPALADMSHAGHDANMKHGAMASMANTPSAGVVKKVDPAQGKLTIQHGPLENLGMPPMTMIFRVQNHAMLERVKPGDNVHFLADRVNGKLTVTQIEVIR